MYEGMHRLASKSKFNDKEGAAACTSCEAGSFAEELASISCQLCPSGRHQSSAGNSECESCPSGFFSPSPGASSCLKCTTEYGVEYDSAIEASNCSRCIRSYFMVDGICEECPIGAICEEPGQALESLVLAAGFYRFQHPGHKKYTRMP